jgi:hypothetical protein
MSDPRFTDPRYSDPRLSDPVLRHDESVGGVWGWIAGLAVIALVMFLLIAGWNSNSTTASNNPAAPGSSALRHVTPPSTTGQGSGTMPRPVMPAQPNKSGTQ